MFLEVLRVYTLFCRHNFLMLSTFQVINCSAVLLFVIVRYFEPYAGQ